MSNDDICNKKKIRKRSSEDQSFREFGYILIECNIHLIFIKIHTKFMAKFLDFCNKSI